MTADETIEAIRLTNKVESLLQKAEAKEGILLDACVGVFRDLNRLQTKLLTETQEETLKMLDSVRCLSSSEEHI